MNPIALITSESFLPVLNNSLLLILLVASTWFDIKSRRIPNWLVLVGITASFGTQVLSGFGSVSTWGLGLLVGFGLFIPLYVFRAMGAGDVKLMAVVGSFIGPNAAISAVFMTLIAGGVLALGVSLWCGALRSVYFNVRFVLLDAFFAILHGGTVRVSTPLNSAGHLPYAVAIAAGTLIHLIMVFTGYALFA